MIFDPAALQSEVDTLKEALSEETTWQDAERSKELSVRLSRLQSLLDDYTRIERQLADIDILLEVIREEQALSELSEIAADLEDLIRELKGAQLRHFLSGPYDQKN
ncbi:MAG: PCRF domain-containing protein, partial [bacterium JZ-2024 1]